MQNTSLPKNRTREKQQNIMQEYENVEIAHAKTELTYSTCGGRIWRGRRATNLFIRTTLVRSTPVLCCSVSRNCFRACVLFPFEYLISSRIIMDSIYAFFSWFVLFQKGQICTFSQLWHKLVGIKWHASHPSKVGNVFLCLSRELSWRPLCLGWV